jgi:hypothetical protein
VVLIAARFPFIVQAAFAGVINGGNSVAASLYHVVSGVDAAATSVFNTLSADLIIPALTRVSNELNGVVATVGVSRLAI